MSKHQGKNDPRQQKPNETRQTNVTQTQKPQQQGSGGSGNLSKNWQQNFNNPTSRLEPQKSGKRK